MADLAESSSQSPVPEVKESPTPSTPVKKVKAQKSLVTSKNASSGVKKPSHPATSELVLNAIKTLQERNGSSLQAIKKFIVTTYKLDMEKLAPFIKKYLKNAVASGKLIQTKGKGASGSFKLPAIAVKPTNEKKKKNVKQKSVDKKLKSEKKEKKKKDKLTKTINLTSSENKKQSSTLKKSNITKSSASIKSATSKQKSTKPSKVASKVKAPKTKKAPSVKKAASNAGTEKKASKTTKSK